MNVSYYVFCRCGSFYSLMLCHATHCVRACACVFSHTGNYRHQKQLDWIIT